MEIPLLDVPPQLIPMEVLMLAAELAAILNLNTKGFLKCRVSDDSAGLCYSFDTIMDAEVFSKKRTNALEGKAVAVYTRGAEVYEYRTQKVC